jgi:membrane-bound lytic murein transglycosylase F
LRVFTNIIILGRRSFFYTIFLVLFFSCNNNSTTEHATQTAFRDLDGIRERGKLVAVTDYNSTNYFIYKGEPMGFHYELLEAFSRHLGLKLEIKTENDIEQAFNLLNTGEADIVAMGLTVNSERKDLLTFSEPLVETRQVLIQRKPEKWRSMTLDRVNSMLLRNHLDLAGKVIYVQKGSSYLQRIKHLQQEIGDTIYTVELPYEAEVLISLVAKGEIDYTISDEHVAKVNGTYYHNIDVSTPVSFTQNQAWGMRKLRSEQLSHELNTWLEGYRKSGAYALAYAKYYRNSRSGIIQRSEYFTNNTGRISPWDEMIRQYSDSISWDWRLVAALMYQESRFDPYVTSGAGAHGLMQVMPATGKHFGIDVFSSPEQNIKAGVLYLRWLDKMFEEKIPDGEERMHFVLASYNAGPGHVLDAMRLASKNGKDSTTWFGNVERYILKKSEPAYYKDPEVQHGRFKGVETVNFVTDIMKRYDHYRNLTR